MRGRRARAALARSRPSSTRSACARPQLERAERFATARELGDARAALSSTAIATSRCAAMLARAELDVAARALAVDDAGLRGDALRAAGRALALDPTAPSPPSWSRG